MTPDRTWSRGSGRRPVNPIKAAMKKYWLYIGLSAIALFIAAQSLAKWQDFIADYFLKFEKFRANPYWDFKQWSWGYGTRVPGSIDSLNYRPAGSITRIKALQDAFDHVYQDYYYLKNLIKVPLTAGQWAALLSFSYNTGPGNADNLVANINAKNWSALKNQWILYNKAGGIVQDYLVKRRAYEINSFIKDV
jgi:GH24 family phage-related lysozyme (muramidase)